MSVEHPLIQRLVTEFQYPTLTSLKQLNTLNSDSVQVLFFPGNPTLYPEALDVAVILPELNNAFTGRMQPILVDEEHEDEFKRRFHFDSWPALVFVKQGIMVGSICKVQDWADYMSQVGQLLDTPAHLTHVIPTNNQGASL